jgi:hypothetical protein
VSAAKWALKQVQGDEEGFGSDMFRHAELVSASIVALAQRYAA